jgi:hypothetical protein
MTTKELNNNRKYRNISCRRLHCGCRDDVEFVKTIQLFAILRAIYVTGSAQQIVAVVRLGAAC